MTVVDAVPLSMATANLVEARPDAESSSLAKPVDIRNIRIMPVRETPEFAEFCEDKSANLQILRILRSS